LGLRTSDFEELDDMPERLTPRAIASLAATGHRIAIWDAVVPGLVLRVTPAGVKTFSVWYRVNGRARRYTIPGRFPEVDLAGARMRARDVLARARNGDDAHGAKVAARKAPTFEDLAKNFIEAREPNLAASTATEYRRMVACYIHASPLGGSPAPDMRRGDVKRFLEGLARRAPVMGNRVYQLVRAVCRWAVREELLPSNPCEGLQRPRREQSRDRVLKDEEIVALWKALDGEPPEVIAEPPEVAAVVKALVLLGQRSSETIEMRRSDLDLGAKTWTIPGQFRKGGRTHVVPLSAVALQLIGNLSTKVDRAFEGVSAVNAERDWWDRVRQKAMRLGVQHFTKHDLRRTCATGCARLGASDFIVSKILGHATQPGIQVTQVYNRYSHLSEMASALNAWAAHIERITTRQDRTADILPLRRA
jgi:integrase